MTYQIISLTDYSIFADDGSIIAEYSRERRIL